ncbi:MipA/OmpV family protein [Shewanella sp. cp20]|uniref:MipA/OmpV family protein n=1 Tax=Shewanella sp. cp20 TaxID=1521167 RepID=UPI00059EE783|nr:MipA/OmpV family protein [Shewanella sp. cp20]KIO38289.1 membrane protein [Shewanella sp. cp20]
MKKLCFLISTALISNCALAEGNTYIRNGNIYSHQGQFFASAGAVTGSEFYQGQDRKTGGYINGGYHGEDFNADLSGINFRFFKSTDKAIDLSVFVAGNSGFDASDATVLKGMKDKKFSADIGLNADLHIGNDTLSAKFQHDVTGVYNGYQADLTYYRPTTLGFADFVPYVGVHYFSNGYVNYYTGVSKADATPKRPTYKASGSLAYKLGYALVIPITENIDITQSTSYTYLGSGLANSPLVDSRNQWMTTLGVSYSF